MGGDATFSGTTYQANVIAYIYAHILAQARLGWLSPADDTPIAVSGETGGPGDDALVEFGDRHSPIEVQAKRGLTAGAELNEVVDRIRAKSSPGSSSPVVLVVDRGSTRKLYTELGPDLGRIRSRRTDGLRPVTGDLLKHTDGDLELLRRLYLVTLDDRA